MARVIFLDVPIQEISLRIGDWSQRGVVIRPGMTLDDLLEERRPLYLKYADDAIDCAGKSHDELLFEIRELMKHQSTKVTKI